MLSTAACSTGRSVKSIHLRDDAKPAQTVDEIVPMEDTPIAKLFNEKTGHLSDKDAAFFRKWETLLTVEEQDIGRFRSQLWTMSAKERERSGRYACCSPKMAIALNDE